MYGLLLISRRKRGDYRTRRDRPQVRTNAWRKQIDSLANRYLTFNREGPPPNDPPPNEHTMNAEWHIPVVDMFGTSPSSPLRRFN